MKQKALKVHPADNVMVALVDLQPGETIHYRNENYTTTDLVPAKHKFALAGIPQGAEVIMYGVLVGRAQTDIHAGGLLSTNNVKHDASGFLTGTAHTEWQKPDVSRWQNRTFNGYHREDGGVGTANYWLVVPMVFCENRNLEVLQEALVKQLGYGRKKSYEIKARQLINRIRNGSSIEEILY